ncbi:hypothetical protein N7468_003959 [Penicillium chermesinum]|uniref:Uncharacterized protein n=1 Tax=Penicillium chermesinum TaxID=63820 RepID=A0A9W9P7W5_9EURO|nr:uncharacterized protein N7468_003959 [Penicillium chermesinum]KAJ5239340.1 hypothetical protein N7468_003959 [Penicillium chermesinum]
MAASAVKFHSKYLADLEEHKHVLWPHPTSRLIVAPERCMHDGHMILFEAPAFVSLRKRYPMITTPVILKAALALMIILHTNHTHAVFLNLEAQRARLPFLRDGFPFVSANEAADVSGPTFGGVLNLVKFQPTQTVLEYLLRIREDQDSLTKYATVPWHELSRQTGHSMEGTLPRVAESVIFNWMPGLGPAALGENPYRHMTVKQTHIRTKLGMLANAGAGGIDGSQILIFLQGAVANMSTLWVERTAQEMKSIALWLGNEDSLQIQVGEFTKHIP